MDTPLFVTGLQTVSLYAAELIGFTGVLIMCYGTIRGLAAYLMSIRSIGKTITKVRVDIAQHLSLGLEFLVGKDIIETIIRPSIDQLLALALIVLIRTMIAYILAWEMREAIKQIEHEVKLTVDSKKHEKAAEKHDT